MYDNKISCNKSVPGVEGSTFILMTQNGIKPRFLKLWFYAQPLETRSEDNKITEGLFYASNSGKRSYIVVRTKYE